MDQSNLPSDKQILSFGQKLQSGIKYLWENDKIFLIVFGILIVGFKITSFAMDMLAASSKEELNKATEKDAQLKNQENAANQQANALVDAANKLPSQEGPVSEDWYKNGKK